MDELCMMSLLWFMIVGGALSVVVCDFIVPGRLRSAGGMLGAIAYICLALVVIYAYWMTITTPSYAPPDYIPPSSTEQELDEAKRLASGKERTGISDKFARAAVCIWLSSLLYLCQRSLFGDVQDSFDKVRYCTRCQAYKPPRSHHCKFVLVLITCFVVVL